MNQIISFYNSNLFSTPLEPAFATIQIGDVLHITRDVFAQEIIRDRSLEFFVFENQRGEKVKLSLSQILRCKGPVGKSLQTAIWNKDIKTVKDLFEFLFNPNIKLSVDNIEFVETCSYDGRKMVRKVYTFNW